jgi:hypothetical protein
MPRTFDSGSAAFELVIWAVEQVKEESWETFRDPHGEPATSAGQYQQRLQSDEQERRSMNRVRQLLNCTM